MADIFVNNSILEDGAQAAVNKIANILSKEIYILDDKRYEKKNDAISKVFGTDDYRNHNIAWLKKYMIVSLSPVRSWEEPIKNIEENFNKNGTIMIDLHDQSLPDDIMLGRNFINFGGADFSIHYHDGIVFNAPDFVAYLQGSTRNKKEIEAKINKSIEFANLFKSSQMIIFDAYYDCLIKRLFDGASFEDILQEKDYKIVTSILTQETIRRDNYIYYLSW
jgi:hypothetical protein